jgi:1A family penicillin-binding protein
MKRVLSSAQKHFRRTSKKRIRNFIILVISGLLFFGGVFFIWISTFKIPTLQSFDERRVIESTKIYDKTGSILLYDVNKNIQRTVVPYDQISKNIKNATISIEDKNFYTHGGVDFPSIARAVLANITSLKFNQGGSTITQQVVKNSLLSSEKTISRKIKEWVISIKLEKVLTKDEILNLYLNEIPYGGNIYGIEEASQTLLGKSAKDLNVAESAYLAAIPQAPTYYSPYGRNVSKLEDRKNLVLDEMLKGNYINSDTYNKSKKEKVVFLPKQDTGIKAPHFVFYIIDELNKKYGNEVVQNGGLRVKTTLDYNLQQKGEEVAKKFALENKKNFNAENDAFVVIDPKTGGILSMIGSRDYFDKEIDGNFNVATAHRQPGSTFKPFVYAGAFNKGYTPETVLFDVKTQFSTTCKPDDLTSDNGCYSPDNYDQKFRGPITLRSSLAQSINVTSVKTLYLAGIGESIHLAESMGIQSLGDSSQYGLTLVLGGGEVSLLDMTSAYSVFANEGVRNPYTGIIEIRNSKGDVLETATQNSQNVLERESALKISSILSDNDARAPSYGQNSVLYFSNRDVAVKTGTTNDYKDAWIIGYTPSVTLGAWAGNNNNTPMEKKVAGFIVAPMWRAYMDEILKTYPIESFPKPTPDDSPDLKPVLRGEWQGGVAQRIDILSGKNATQYTPKETSKDLLSGGIHSILYWLSKNDPRGPQPQDPNNDPQFKYWEYGIGRWLVSQNYVEPKTQTAPQGFDDIHTESSVPKINLVLNPQGYLTSERIILSPSIQSKYQITKVEYFLNDTYLGQQTISPFVFSFVPQDTNVSGGNQKITVVATDSVFNKGSVDINTTISNQ